MADAALQPRRKGAGMAWTGAALLVLGIVAAVFAVVRLVSGSGIAETFTTPPFDAPGSVVQALSPGGYVVLQRTPTSTSPTTLGPGDVAVTAPDGRPVIVGLPVGHETITRGADVFTAFAAFDAPVAGDYRIAVDSGDAMPVVVTPGVLSSVGRTMGWILGIVVAGLVAFIGLILLIAGLVRRMRTPSPPVVVGGSPAPPPVYPGGYAGGISPIDPPPPGGPGVGLPPSTASSAPPPAPPPAGPPVVPTTPAGWYPDPERAGGQRYWDGAAWTDHLA